MAVLLEENSQAVNRFTRARANGFTLVELLVVLAVLGMLAGLTIPRLFGVIRRSRLQQAARQMADDLGAARLLAINHGIPYELRFERDGAHYAIGPRDAIKRDVSADFVLTNVPDSDRAKVSRSVTTSSVDFNSQTPASRGRTGVNSTIGSEPPGRPVPESIEDELTGGVQFGDRPSATQQVRIPPSVDGASNELPTLEDSLVSAEPHSASWVHAIVFYPDGRAEKHKLKLTDEDGRSVQLTVRGITGSVTIGPIARPPVSVLDGIDNRSPPSDTSETTAEPNDALPDLPKRRL